MNVQDKTAKALQDTAFFLKSIDKTLAKIEKHLSPCIELQQKVDANENKTRTVVAMCNVDCEPCKLCMLEPCENRYLEIVDNG